VDVPSLATDVDTPEDLDALEALLASTGAPAATTRPLIGSLTVESKC
jgi:2-phospho-L-lactate guanylyltransferase (CobY/MobA/RfbA family)